MGCGNVFKKEVVTTKDVDLTFEPKKPPFKDTSESFFFDKRKTGDIVIRNANNAKKNEVKKRESINKKKLKPHMDINKIEQIYNGPIINMLKRQVEKHKKN